MKHEWPLSLTVHGLRVYSPYARCVWCAECPGNFSPINPHKPVAMPRQCPSNERGWPLLFLVRTVKRGFTSQLFPALSPAAAATTVRLKTKEHLSFMLETRPAPGFNSSRGGCAGGHRLVDACSNDVLDGLPMLRPLTASIS